MFVFVAGLVGWLVAKLHTARQDWVSLRARHRGARRSFFSRLGTVALAVLVAVAMLVGWIDSLIHPH